MQTCRFKVRDRRNDWKCCFCCHVRTGTIFFGIWHLLLHVLALSVLAVVLRHPELMTYSESGQVSVKVDYENMGEVLPPTPLTEINVQSGDSELFMKFDHVEDKNPHTIQKANSKSSGRTVYYQDINTCVIFTFCTFMITLLMVYGAIKGKPAYLLPFFCLQVFDFCVSSMTASCFLLYKPDVHSMIAHSPRIPYQTELLQMNEQCLALLVLLTFVVALAVKAYFIAVVWSCYKYLMLRVLPGRQQTIHYIDTESLLPSYEAAVKKYPAPPPSYATATRNHPSSSVPAAASIVAEVPVAEPSPRVM